MKTIFTTILLSIAALCFASDAELRFVENRIEGDKLYVNVEMRGSSYDFNLASHNIRAFYDHTVLEMTEVVSLLPEAKYTSPNLEQRFTDGHDLNVGLLSYEDNMGFINMSTSLNDLVSGGVNVSVDWMPVYTMIFDIKNHNGVAKIAWAMDGVTDQYATAFVEVGEWKSVDKVGDKAVFDLINFELDLAKSNSVNEAFAVEMGPNPTQNFVNIRTTAADASLTIIDLAGSVINESAIIDGASRVDVSGYAAGTYIFMISAGSESYSEQIVITE